MNRHGVWYLLGRLLLALAVCLLVPAAVALSTGGTEAPELAAFLISAAISGLAGVVCQRVFSQRESFAFGRREAFLLVSAAWITASAVGALPFVLVKGPGFAIDALFESASGFTTTGASILTDVEIEPPGLLVWRSLTQWLGGMGIIVLGIAILPKLAVGGMELLAAESTGPIKEKLTPRIVQTAKALWGIYLLLTLILTGGLLALGMGAFDAVNHAFATVSTGGFSTRNASIGAWDSPGIDLLIVAFMFLSATNFALHFQWLRGRPLNVLRDPEFRLYGVIVTTAIFAVSADLYFEGPATQGVLAVLRVASFQVLSVMTTTGFATADFDLWPGFSRALLFVLMFVGGCAGSTSGSIKVVRVLLVFKTIGVAVKRLVQPHAVLPVRLGLRPVPDDVVTAVMTFVVLFVLLFAGGGLLLTLMGLDPLSAFSAAASSLANVGPGFGTVGPMRNFSDVPDPGKLVLTALMIVGRLELYTVLVTLFLLRRRP